MEAPLRVCPSASLGPFVLGDSINQCVHVLRTQFKGLRTQIVFNAAAPLSAPLTLRVVSLDLSLVFAPDTQRLMRVVLGNLADVPLTFANSAVVFKAPTLLKLYNVLGPTHPGKREGDSTYNLQYHGLWLSFTAPLDGQDIPLELADKSSPPAKCLVLHAGPDIDCAPALSPATPCAVTVSILDGRVSVRLASSSVIVGEATAQDVLSELGTPGGIHRKSKENVLLMHLGSTSGNGVDDYLYNYFDLGVDVLFDGHKHVCKKIILHTNLPNRAEFNEYAKCCFRIDWVGGQPVALSCDDAWSTIERKLGKLGRAMVHDKGQTANPFGPSLLYGYDHCVLEVAKASGHLCSVVLF